MQATLPIERPVETKASIASWPFLLYALTGFTGVLAEQGFEKYMSLLVGATAAGSAVVIATYFLGFALGSWIVGRLIRGGRVLRPLRIYGLLEFLIGLSAVAFSYLFHPIVAALAPWQSLFPNVLMKFAVRFVFGVLLILPTAALMGASFPLIAQVVDRRNASSGHSWLRAYASNLVGAVLAALAGAYAILPAIGIRGAFWMCFGICSFVCAVCMAAGSTNGTLTRENYGERLKDKTSELDRDAWILLIAAFGSGFVFFALEVLWTHLIATAIGCSVYAFSAMLTMVLLGLLIAAFRVDRIARRPTAISYSRILQFSALLLVIQLRLWDWGQAIFIVKLPPALSNFYGAELVKLVLAAVLIVPSAAMLGSIYPCLLRSPVLERAGNSFLVGYLNTWNSLGCLAGAVSGVFVLIPLLGAEWSLKLIVCGALTLGFIFFWRENPTRKLRVRTACGVGLVLVYAFLIHWDHRLIASGFNIYFGQNLPGGAAGPPATHTEQKMVFFEEDVQGGMTSVIEIKTLETGAKDNILLTDGKYEGTDNFEGQGRAQIGFAAVPSLYTRDLDRALLIGLGTGQSALALARLGYGQVDIAEFAPGIIAASRQHFARVTGGVLDFPNVRLILEDGRNVLLSDPKRDYDLITVEITSIWFAGATNVYSREFYDLARTRLRPGGVFQQWLQVHHISPREVQSIIATVRSVFPYVSCWYEGEQAMIVASMAPQLAPPGRQVLLEKRMKSLISLEPEEQSRIAREILASRITTPAGVDRMLAARPAVINTDHNRWLEYTTPKYNATNIGWEPINIAFLRSFER